MALIQQERRVSVIKELREELIDYKSEFEGYSAYDNFDESFRALDPECQNIQLISSYDLYISTVLPLEHKGRRLVEGAGVHLEENSRGGGVSVIKLYMYVEGNNIVCRRGGALVAEWL